MLPRVSNRRFWLPGSLVASFVMLIAAGGCGVIPQLPQDVALLDSVFDRTGTLLRDGNFGSMAQSQLPILIGDNAQNQAVCGFISVNLNSLPANATVTKAVLKLKGFIPAGAVGNAFADFGPINVDHVNVVSGISGSDYATEALSSSIATVQPFTNTEGQEQEISIDITDQVIADRAAGRPISSFRFRFDAAPNADGANDLVAIQASMDDLAQRPFALVAFTQ